jgi:tRNA(Ile)-lysidine synthase
MCRGFDSLLRYHQSPSYLLEGIFLEKPTRMSNDSLLTLTRDVIRQDRLIQAGDSVLIAVSGGIDSMVLLDVIIKLQQELQCTLAVAHINHLLRGNESDQDEKFVKSVAEKYGIPCYTKSIDIQKYARERKRSIQDFAREVRYNFFLELRSEYGYRSVATAHHADDNAETMLFNIFRGTGVHGLTGIPVKHKNAGIIRPLLFSTRKQISGYAEQNSIRYCEDSSNAKTEYTRNLIRHQLIPQIQESINPRLTETLTRMSTLFTELEDFLSNLYLQTRQELIFCEAPDEISLHGVKFSVLSSFMKEFFLYSLAKEFTHGEIESGIVREMLKITLSETGASCVLPDGSIFLKNRDQLIFKLIEGEQPFAFPIEINKTYEFDRFYFRSELIDTTKFSRDPFIEYIDCATLTGALTLRSWRHGDWFIPLGMAEKRKLSDFFIDEKIPLFEKKKIPILESDGKIVWICGKRLDDRYKISSGTRQILKLEYRPRHRTE